MSASALIDNDVDVVTTLTPNQILNTIIEDLSPLKAILYQTMKSSKVSAIPKAVRALTHFGQYVDKIIDDFNLALLDNDCILTTISDEDVDIFRQNLLDLNFTIPYLDSIYQDSKISNSLSQLLFLFDQLLIYRSAMPTKPTNPLDTSRAAFRAQAVVSAILGSPSNMAVMNLEDHLLNLDQFFNDLRVSYEDVTVIAPPVERLIKFFEETVPDFEVMTRNLINSHLGNDTHNLLMSLNLIAATLRNMDFGDEMLLTFDPEAALQSKIEIQNNIDDSIKQIMSHSLQPAHEVTVASLAKLAINPSRKAYAYTATDKVASILALDKDGQQQMFQQCAADLAEITTEMNSLATIDNTILPLVTSFNTRLIECGAIKDAYMKSKVKINDLKLDELYHDTVKSYDQIILGINQTSCIQADGYTIKSALSIVNSLLNHSIQGIQTAVMANPKVAAEGKKNLQALKDIRGHLEPLTKNLTESVLLAHIDQITADLDIVANLQSKCKTFDHACRECYLRHNLMHITPALTILIMNSQRFEIGEYPVSQVIDDLNDAENSFRELMDKIAIRDANFPTKCVLSTMALALHDVSSVRSGLAFEGPKRFLPMLTDIRTQLLELPRILKFVAPDLSCLDALNSVSLARWKLARLEGDFEHDRALQKILNDAVSQMKSASDAIKLDAFTQFYNAKIAEIEEISSGLGKMSERNGDENVKWPALFAQIITEISAQWKPPRTAPAKNAMNGAQTQLNKAIELLGQTPQTLPDFADPITNYKDTILFPYLQVAAVNGGESSFYEHARDALTAANYSMLLKAVNAAEEYINSSKVIPESAKAKFAYLLMYPISIAHMLSNRLFEEMNTAAIANMKTSSKYEQSVLDIYVPLRDVYELSIRTKPRDPQLIAARLLQLYLAPPKQCISEVYYFTALYSRTNEKFTRLLPEIAKCVQTHAKLHKSMFAKYTDDLRKKLPAVLQSRQLTIDEESAELSKAEYLVADECDPLQTELGDWQKLASPTIKYEFQEPVYTEYSRYSGITDNEYNLTECDLNQPQSEINVAEIGVSIRALSSTREAPKMKINDFCSFMQPAPQCIVQPHFTKISLSGASFGKDSLEATATFGIVDLSTGESITQVLTMLYKKGKPGNDHIAFMIPKPTDDLALVCRLYARGAKDPSDFVKNKKAVKDAPLSCFAVAVFSLFENGHAICSEALTDFHLGKTSLMNNAGLRNATRPDSSLNIRMGAHISTITSSPHNMCQTWSTKKEKILLAMPITICPAVAVPIIALSELKLVFAKIPTAKFAYLKAFLSKEATDLKEPAGEPMKSCLVQLSKTTYFPDVIQFPVTADLPPTAHIIIHVVTTDGSKENIAKVSVIPLFPSGEPASPGALTTAAAKITKYTKDYLKEPLKPKTAISTKLMMPPLYFPTSEISAVKEGKAVREFTKSSPAAVLGNLFPVLSTLFAKPVENFSTMVAYLATTNPKQALQSLWSLNLAEYDQNNLVEWLKVFSSTLRTESDQVCSSLPCMTRIATLVMVHLHQKSVSIETEVAEIAGRLAIIAGRFRRWQNATFIFQELGTMLNIVANIIIPSTFVDAVKASIDALNDEYNTVSNTRLPFAESDGAARTMQLKYAFYAPLAKRNILLAHFSTGRFSIIDDILKALEVGFSYGMTREWINLMADLVRTLEHFPLTAARIAPSFAPYISIAADHCSDLIFENDPDLTVNFVAPLMAIMRCTEPQDYDKVFPNHVLSKFFRCLTVISGLILSKDDGAVINYELFDQFSLRVVGCLYTLLSNRRIQAQSALAELIDCLSTLVPGHQKASTVRKVSAIFSLVLQRFSRQIYTIESGAAMKFVKAAFDLVVRQHPISRSVGTALLIHWVYKDYLLSKTIDNSTGFFLAGLSDAMEIAPHEKLPLFMTLIERISLHLDSLHVGKLPELATAAMKAAREVFNSSLALRKANKAPEYQTQNLMQILSFFKQPILRLNYLEKVVKANGESASAFMAQVHIVTLISTVVSKADPTVPLFETPYNISENIDETCTDRRFSVEGLTAAVSTAIDIASASRLYWQARPLFAYALQLGESSEKICKVYQQMERQNKSPLFFYLLTVKRNSKIVSQRVFCSPISDLRKFCAYLNDTKACRFEYHEPARPAHDYVAINAKERGIFVVPIQPNCDFLTSDGVSEFTASSKLPVNGWDDVSEKEVQITTVDKFPNALAALDIASLKNADSTRVECLGKQVDRQIEKLRREREHLSNCMPTEQFIDMWRKAKPMFSVVQMITLIKEALDSDLQNELKQGMAGPAKSKAEKMNSDYIAELVKDICVVRRAMEDHADKLKYSKTMASITNTLAAYAAETRFGPINTEPAALKCAPAFYHANYEEY